MSGISHKQAIQLVNWRMDGLLNESQCLLLEEHLRSCDSCRDYANHMDGLSAHLQNEFHHRWDARPGPSQKVSEQVMTKTRNIPMTNRISSSVKLLAGVMALILLGVAINFVVSRLQSTSPVTNATKPVDTSPLPQERLLAFTSDQNGNFDIYTMHADGTDLTNLTNYPASDTNPIWSPDGKHIAFESDRDGFMQIYLMDADGSNVIQLTNDEADHGLYLNIDGKYSPWSPDGSKLLFLQSAKGGELAELYMQEITGENKILLARRNPQRISWSPDGKYVGYVLNDSPNPNETFVPGIYIVDADGNNLRELKKLIPQNEYLKIPYYWSSGGQSIVFITDKNDPARQVIYSLPQTIYEFNLETNTLLHKGILKPTVIDWGEEVSLSLYTEKGGSSFVWQRSDGTSNTLAWDDSNCLRDITRSMHGNFAIGAYCLDSKNFKLYWANADGSTIKQLLDWPTSIGSFADITWSPDDQYVGFTLDSSLYILNVEDALKDSLIEPEQVAIAPYTIPSWQPIADENIAKEIPTPRPTSTSSPNGLVDFTSEQNGDLDIYTIRPDGSGLVNLTNNPAKDYSPNWSPDGTHIAFVSDRDGNDNIYIMNYDGTNLLQLTDDQASDSVPLWSPDGTKIAYMSGSFIKKNTNIHVVDLNGQNHRQLTNYAPGTGVMSHAWSPDSQYLLFDVNFRIARINANGGDITPITPPTKTITPYYVMSKDSSMLSYLTDCEDIKTFCYQLRLAYADATHQESSIGFNTLKTPELCEIKQTATWTGIFVQWSPDQSKILFAFTCEESGWFYISNADGSDFKPLTNYPILGNMPQNDVAMFDWSSDSQSIVFMAALDKPENESLYILNVDDALQNPELRPTRVNTSISQVMSPAWQPAP